MDYGLLGGLAEGLKQGLLGYQGVKKSRLEQDQLALERALKERALANEEKAKQGTLFASGVMQDESGNFALTPEEQLKRDRAYRTDMAKAMAGGLTGIAGEPSLKLREKMLDVAKKEREAQEIEGPKASAATYGRRMETADKIIQDLQKGGYDRTSRLSSIKDAITPSSMLPEQRKMQDQAEMNFLNAVLRRESGAAISDTERASGETQYFPRAGDTPAIIAQKAQNRAQAIAGLRAESGRAWDKIGTSEAPAIAEAPKERSGGLLSIPQANATAMPPVPQGRVRVQTKDGAMFDIDPSKLKDALADGAVQVK